MLLAVALAAAASAHVPFFDEHRIQRDIDISQAYYFRRPATLRPGGQLPSDTLVEVVARDRDEHCTATVVCDNDMVEHPFAAAGDAIGEPFTQSAYRRVVRFESMTCTTAFSIAVDCHSPWAAVVGRKEQFTAGDMVWRFPAAIARIHGHHWNEFYLAGDLTFYGYLLLVTLALASPTTQFRLDLRGWALVLAALIGVSWFLARFAHAILFAGPAAGAGIGVAFVEVLPLLAVALLWYCPRDTAAAAIAVLLATGSLFLFGAGYVWAPVLIFAVAIHDIWTAAAAPRQTGDVVIALISM